MQVTLSRRFRTIQVYPKDMGGGARPQSAELSMNSRNPPVHRSLSASRPKIGRNAAIAKRWATATQLTVLEPCVELELEPRQQHLRDAGVDLAHEGADAHGADHESPVGRKARHDPRGGGSRPLCTASRRAAIEAGGHARRHACGLLAGRWEAAPLISP